MLSRYFVVTYSGAVSKTELQTSVCGIRPEGEVGNTSSVSLPPKLPIAPANVSSTPELGNGVPLNPERQNKKLLLLSKGVKQINRIYADWIDDLHSLNNKATE